jgi:hypothetical protein
MCVGYSGGKRSRQLQWKIRTRGRPRTRWRDEVEEDWEVMGLKNKLGMVEDRWECNNNNNNIA